MANDILTVPVAKATLTCTLASLANGSAQQSTMVSNSSNYPAAVITLRIKSGAVAPTAGFVYEIYLLRGDDAASSTYRDDNAGSTNASITIENAPLLGTIVVTATTAKNFYGSFDTSPLGPLGPEWGIAIKNSSGAALSSTEGDHLKGYVYYRPQVQ